MTVTKRLLPRWLKLKYHQLACVFAQSEGAADFHSERIRSLKQRGAKIMKLSEAEALVKQRAAEYETARQARENYGMMQKSPETAELYKLAEAKESRAIRLLSEAQSEYAWADPDD